MQSVPHKIHHQPLHKPGSEDRILRSALPFWQCPPEYFQISVHNYLPGKSDIHRYWHRKATVPLKKSDIPD